MSAYCSSPSCLNGNCPGCKNGSKFCNDPRCYPDCPDCSGETELECLGGRTGWDWTIIIIIGILVLLVLILFVSMGSQSKNTPQQPAQMYQSVGYQTVPLSVKDTNDMNPQLEVNTRPTGMMYQNPSTNMDIDASLNVPEPAYISTTVPQKSFTTSIPCPPEASIPSPANISVASARPIPGQINNTNQSNTMINGFN